MMCRFASFSFSLGPFFGQGWMAIRPVDMGGWTLDWVGTGNARKSSKPAAYSTAMEWVCLFFRLLYLFRALPILVNYFSPLPPSLPLRPTSIVYYLLYYLTIERPSPVNHQYSHLKNYKNDLQILLAHVILGSRKLMLLHGQSTDHHTTSKSGQTCQ
ncbi:hypothetical protein ASPBRDRAFT_630731 [Aspergillus brasiliensis CBS 101740]|uniref:Uncharacterized protein n=1 Tax=Aspergillus brasiliensis (strain CBS 101740 / IMI 381727 / IBT 21946) TaxID=767769 RepID=A0A1L9UG82_ASPBC|nr:hypothetical protein ASPBRDRAFT_630731 [Aspergillus brasiliensis CBS 101740]